MSIATDDCNATRCTAKTVDRIALYRPTNTNQQYDNKTLFLYANDASVNCIFINRVSVMRSVVSVYFSGGAQLVWE